MTSSTSTSTGAGERPAWQQKGIQVAIGLAAAALLFFLGWMMGRGPAADLERERDEARTHAALLSAQVDVYRSAVALEARNFGTANQHLRSADAALDVVPAEGDVAGIGPEAESALAEIRSTLATTDLNVAVDVETQRAAVLQLAERLDEVISSAAGETEAVVP